MIPDFSGDFLNFESTSDGDIVEIMAGGGKMEFSQKLGKNLYNIKVKKGDKEMTYSPNNTAGRLLQQAFGKDDTAWAGKKFQVVHVEKKMLIRPIVEQKV